MSSKISARSIILGIVTIVLLTSSARSSWLDRDRSDIINYVHLKLDTSDHEPSETLINSFVEIARRELCPVNRIRPGDEISLAYDLYFYHLDLNEPEMGTEACLAAMLNKIREDGLCDGESRVISNSCIDKIPSCKRMYGFCDFSKNPVCTRQRTFVNGPVAVRVLTLIDVYPCSPITEIEILGNPQQVRRVIGNNQYPLVNSALTNHTCTFSDDYVSAKLEVDGTLYLFDANATNILKDFAGDSELLYETFEGDCD